MMMDKEDLLTVRQVRNDLFDYLMEIDEDDPRWIKCFSLVLHGGQFHCFQDAFIFWLVDPEFLLDVDRDIIEQMKVFPELKSYNNVGWYVVLCQDGNVILFDAVKMDTINLAEAELVENFQDYRSKYNRRTPCSS